MSNQNYMLIAPAIAYRDIVVHAAEEGRIKAIRLLDDIRDQLDSLAELGFSGEHTLSSVREFVSHSFKVLLP